MPPKRDTPYRHAVVIGHPAPGSFNHAIASTWCAGVAETGQIADINDLYASGFDPRLAADERPGPRFRPPQDIAAEIDRVTAADALVLVYPIWFGLPPAIIKGYVDRVMGAGLGAEAVKAREEHPMLKGKHLTIFSTSAATRPWLEERGQWLALKQAFDNYLVSIFGLSGCHHVHFDAIVPGMTGRVAEEHLEVVRRTARERCAQLAYGTLPPKLMTPPSY